MKLLEFDNVSKIYYGRNVETRVFEDLSFCVQEGEFVALLGRSGSGKSTVLHLAGLLRQRVDQLFARVDLGVGAQRIHALPGFRFGARQRRQAAPALAIPFSNVQKDPPTNQPTCSRPLP